MDKLSMRAVTLSISLLIMSPTAVAPAVADIIAAFPEVNPNITMWVVTLPSIVMVFFSLLYGTLVKILPKRTLLVLALTFFLIGGIVPAFLGNIYLILAMRALLGAGVGFIMPMSTGLITDFYREQDQADMMGWQSAVVNFGGLIFMFLGGILAAIHWNYTFLAYSVGLIVAIWVLIKLPGPPVDNKTQPGSVKIPGQVYGLIAGVFIFNLLFFNLMTNTSVMVSNEGLGDASHSGTILTLFMVGGFVAGIIFGKAAALFGNYTNSLGWLATGTGMLVIGISNNITVIVVGAFIAGCGMATTMPSYLIKVARISPPSTISTAYALLFCFVGVGQFISPIVFEQIINIFGEQIGRFPILVSAIALLFIGLVSVFATIMKRGNSKS